MGTKTEAAPLSIRVVMDQADAEELVKELGDDHWLSETLAPLLAAVR